jgi:EAL domain-containing protein (putative c-di-GMP-specific phosphodiesterase class I)
MPSEVSRGRVLVVDDEAPLRALISLILTDGGYEVTACANGRAALEALEHGSYDAILSDVRMPDMDGLGLLRAVREKDLDLPVVLCTGGPSLETAMLAVEYGALQYLLKPMTEQQLLEAAGRAVKLGVLARLKRQALASAGYDSLVGDRAGLEGSFGRALETLWMACQPIVRAEDGGLHGHEALLRSSEALFPNPGALLTAGEHLGRLPDLGRAIRAAVARLLESGALPGAVFVNLHPVDLVDDSLLDSQAPLSRFAPRVVLEITERARLEGVANVPGRVASLRRLGFHIALDDLGAGYAGLNSFTALAPDIVKLDMSLIRGLDVDAVKQKLVVSMTGVCRDLGILVVAEGIETEGEREAAVRSGCSLLQGYLIGRPGRIGPP